MSPQADATMNVSLNTSNAGNLVMNVNSSNGTWTWNINDAWRSVTEQLNYLGSASQLAARSMEELNVPPVPNPVVIDYEDEPKYRKKFGDAFDVYFKVVGRPIDVVGTAEPTGLSSRTWRRLVDSVDNYIVT